MENQANKKAMEEELMRGREMANQLLEVVVGHGGDKQVSKLVLSLAEDVVRKVLCSFTNTLLLLNSNNCNQLGHVSTNCPNLETIDQTCKGQILNTHNNRRRCNKRKSIALTWEKDSPILTEDGHAWRKYGQKRTSNAKFLKNYYRCSHRNDEGCLAVKQVQRIGEDPPLYRTTYYGHHTCKTTLNHPHIILEPDSSSDSSILLSFECKQEHQFSSSQLASMTYEPMQVIDHDDHIAQNLLLYDQEFSIDYSNHFTMLSSNEPVPFDYYVYEQFGF